VLLYRESRSVACPVVIEQEVEVVDAENRLLPNRNIEFKVLD